MHGAGVSGACKRHARTCVKQAAFGGGPFNDAQSPIVAGLAPDV